MEKSKHNTLLVIILLACLIVAMYLCGMLGFFLAKKTAPQRNDAVNANQYDSSYDDYDKESKETFSPVENVTVTDKNDYLVIAEEKLVNLYILTPDGDKVFDSILEIDKNTLTESDCFLLEQGIILDTREDLWSLIEDYTS